MSVSYDKLWKILIDKKMNRTELKDSSGISFNVLAKMGKNEFVSMESLMKIELPKKWLSIALQIFAVGLATSCCRRLNTS